MSEPTPTEPKRCEAVRKDGQPCGSLVVSGRYCFTHDPERAEQRKAAHQKGGRNSAKIARLRGLVPPRLQAVYDTLEGALAEVHDGALAARQAMAMAALARAMVAVLTAGELEERVRELELANGGGAK